MKRSNVKVGQFIEAKVTVLPYHIAGESYEVVAVEPRHYGGALDCRIQTKDEGGQPFKRWVSSTDFRKVKGVEQGDAVPTDVKKGTKVLCVQDFVEPRFSDYFKEGVVYVVQKDGLDRDGELNLEHPSLGGGHGYGKPQNFRLYKEPQTEECTTQNLEVGDTVLVGAAGAGYRYVDPDLAGKVCTVSDVAVSKGEPDLLRITHPDVCPRGYTTYSKYLTKIVKEAVVEPEPVVQEKLPPTYIQVGDYILSSGRDPELEADTLYEVVEVDPRHIGIALHTSSHKVWQECYCLTMSDYSKVLREVQPDADMAITEPASILVGCTVRVKEDIVARHGENIPKGTTGVVASIRGDNGQYIVYSPIGWLGQFTVDKDVLEQVEGDADVPTA